MIRTFSVLNLVLILALLSCTKRNEKALHYKKEAYVLLYESRFSEAESAIKKSLDLNPSDPESWYILGNIYMNTKKIDAAIEAYTKAIETDSTFGPAYVNRGKILKEKKLFDAACQDFLKAEKYGMRSIYEDAKFCK
ncbi:MAG: tetratricopeptide repeat protein [Bacteroidales bacterium]|nr:tetratricopeptide repeat protein [Bacteroidales bacterium]